MNYFRPLVLTGTEACEILGVTEGELEILIERSLIKGFRVGEDVRVGLVSLEEYLGNTIDAAKIAAKPPQRYLQ